MNTVEDLCVLIEQNLTDTHRLDGGHVRPDTPLLVSGLLDSLTILRIVGQVEQHLGVKFPESAVVARNFRTPEALWTVLGQLSTREAAT